MIAPARLRFVATLTGVALLGLAGCESDPAPVDTSEPGPFDTFCEDFTTFATGRYYDQITDFTDLSQVLGAQDELVKAGKQIRPPEEIASAWSVVFKTTEDHAVAMRGIDWSDKQALADYLDFMNTYNSPELDAAEAEVKAFVSENCSG